MWRILDWIDDFTDGDRKAVRVLLGLACVFVLLVAADTVYRRWIVPAPQGICVQYPRSRLCSGEPLPTFSPEQIDKLVDDIFKEAK